MTTELTKAAQAALNACERIVDQEDSPVQFGIDFRALGSSLRRALTQRPAAQDVEVDTGPRVLREVFVLCEDTMTKMESESTDFSRGRAFEAKGISRAIGTWFQDEFCGRSHMGEPVIAPTQPAAQATPEPVPADQAKWCEYVAGMVDCWINSHWPNYNHMDEERRVKAIAVIIERRLWALNKQPATPTQQAAGEPVGELVAALPDGISFHVRWLAHSGPALKVGDRIYTHPAPGVPEGWHIAITGADEIVVRSTADGPGGMTIPANCEGALAVRLLDALCRSMLTASRANGGAA